MPRSKEGRTREKIDPRALESAVNDIIKGTLKVNEAARRYGLSNSTVSRHYKNCLALGLQLNEDQPQYTYNSEKNAVRKVFTNDEVMLVSYLKQSAILHYGLTKKKNTLKLAFCYAKALSEQPYSKTEIPKEWVTAKAAGEFWLRGFRKRHPTLSLRKPEATSLARATSFNKANVSSFFDNLQMVMKRDKFRPSDIYNLDETGNSTVHVPSKILCTKGTKQVGSATSGERGLNITMIACVNAIGNSIPPMLIFIEEQKRIKEKRKSVCRPNKKLFPATKKNNPKKKFKGNTADVTSSEDEQMSFSSCDEDYDLSMQDLMQGVLDEEMDVVLENSFIECGEIKPNDYVLVKIAGKKRVLHYVAKILKKIDILYEIQYLVKTGTKTFILRDETSYEIGEEDIICKLPLPSTSGTSVRLKQVIKFPVDFSSYNMPMDSA